MDDFTSIQYRRRLAQITGIDSFSKNTIDESAKERERITDIIEDFEVGRKVNVTNPKATPRYEITGKDDTHYHLKGPNDKTMKLPKDRIHRVNKVNEEQIDEVKQNKLDELDIRNKVNRTLKRLNFSFIGDKPKDIVKRNKELSDRDVKSLHKSMSTNPPAKNSPAELQKKVLDREMNKRKLSSDMNEEQIDEVKRSADYLHSTATEDQRAPTLKTYHTAMAKYSDLPPRAAHIKALNDTIDKHGVKNANQHVTKHFYSHMQKHLSDED